MTLAQIDKAADVVDAITAAYDNTLSGEERRVLTAYLTNAVRAIAAGRTLDSLAEDE